MFFNAPTFLHLCKSSEDMCAPRNGKMGDAFMRTDRNEHSQFERITSSHFNVPPFLCFQFFIVDSKESENVIGLGKRIPIFFIVLAEHLESNFANITHLNMSYVQFHLLFNFTVFAIRRTKKIHELNFQQIITN